MSFPKYEAYQDSGVEWLGEVPEHWSVEPLKYHAQVFPSNVDKKTYEGQAQIHLCNYTDVYYNDEIIEGMNFMPATATEEQIDKFSLRAGDVIFTKDSETANDIAIAAYVPRNLPGVICGYHLSMVRSNTTVDGAFIKRFFDSRSAKAYFEVSANGLTRVGLGQYATDNIPTPVPPLKEQTQISRFLDHETARIDTLIAEQQRLIELLKEKRQAVISHAVTKGLDPTAPLKDSGVEWLGEVPAHWEVGSLGYYSKIDTGATPDRSKPEYWNGDVPWIKTGEVKYETIFQAEEYISIEGVNNSAARIAPKGTLLMAMYGQGVTRGRVAILNIDAAYNQACAGISVEPQLQVRFLRDYLMAAYPYIRDDGNETSQMNLSSGYIAKIKVTVPPIQEQMTISDFIERETEKFDSLISEATSVAVLLQERRSALISAAVTGKIDVRDWQAPASASPAPTLEPVHG